MTTDLQAERAGRRLLRLHTAAMILAGVALFLAAFGLVRAAVVVAFVILLAVISSLETMRVLVFSDREPRR